MLMSPLSSFIYRDGLHWAAGSRGGWTFWEIERSNSGPFTLFWRQQIYLDKSFTSETVQTKRSKLVNQVQHGQEYISTDWYL